MLAPLSLLVELAEAPVSLAEPDSDPEPVEEASEEPDAIVSVYFLLFKGSRAHTNASRVSTSGSSIRARSSVGAAARASTSGDREERGRDARGLARSVGSSLLLSAVTLGAITSAGSGLVGGQVVGARNADAGSLAANISGTT